MIFGFYFAVRIDAREHSIHPSMIGLQYLTKDKSNASEET